MQNKPAIVEGEPHSVDAGSHELAGVIKSAARVMELFEYPDGCRRLLSVTDVVRGLVGAI